MRGVKVHGVRLGHGPAHVEHRPGGSGEPVRGPVRVRFTAEAGRVRVAVHDGSSRLPVARKPGVRETGGRGLGIVEAPADGCGVADGRRGVLAEGGWFEPDAKWAPAP